MPASEQIPLNRLQPMSQRVVLLASLLILACTFCFLLLAQCLLLQAPHELDFEGGIQANERSFSTGAAHLLSLGTFLRKCFDIGTPVDDATTTFADGFQLTIALQLADHLRADPEEFGSLGAIQLLFAFHDPTVV